MKRLACMLVLLAATAQAQTNPPPPPPAAQPDIAILTNVHARELQFEQVGQVAVKVWGEVNGKPALTVDRSDRENLPEQVQPRVLYRDIGIRLTITSTLPDIETILDEALGTAPAAPPPSTQNPVVRKPPARGKKSRR
jgi:hypothetical protein